MVLETWPPIQINQVTARKLAPTLTAPASCSILRFFPFAYFHHERTVDVVEPMHHSRLVRFYMGKARYLLDLWHGLLPLLIVR